MTPKPDAAVVWGKIIYYARVSDCLPVKQEFYDQHGKLKKAHLRQLQENGRPRIPTSMKMVSFKKSRDPEQTVEEYTLMEIKDVRST